MSLPHTQIVTNSQRILVFEVSWMVHDEGKSLHLRRVPIIDLIKWTLCQLYISLHSSDAYRLDVESCTSLILAFYEACFLSTSQVSSLAQGAAAAPTCCWTLGLDLRCLIGGGSAMRVDCCRCLCCNWSCCSCSCCILCCCCSI